MYKIGDKVRVRERFWDIVGYIPVGNIPHGLAGQIGVITNVYNPNGGTALNIKFEDKQHSNLNGWSWSENWIEPYDDENEKFKKLLLNT